MKTLNELELRVLEKIKPREEEYRELREAYRLIKETLEKVLSESSIQAEVTLQGSVEHDTWLSGDKDLDIFVLFPGEWSKKDLETRGLPLIVEAARRIGVYELRYAEHPYVRVRVGNVEADIVAALKLPSPTLAKTAVDRTPFHTEFIKRNLPGELRDHVRLLKKFMKAIGVYGAEVKTRGFSGYATELLILAYGGFHETLEAVSNWNPPVFVNTLGDGYSVELEKKLRERYPDSLIYMPDPVDPLRNTTASVNARSLFTFILAARCYLSNPSEVFFEEPQSMGINELVEATRDRCIVFIEYKLREQLPPDVIWGEAWRVASTTPRILRSFDIEVVDYSAWSNERDTVVIGLELAECILPYYKHYEGPCLGSDEERITSFITKHMRRGYGPWIGHRGCLESLDERRHRSAMEIIASRWREYTVSPHLRLTMPVVYEANSETLKNLYERGAGPWLSSFIVKTPKWMEKCIS